MSTQKKIQAEEYNFPYHHIANKVNNQWWFSRHWPYAPSYIASIRKFEEYLSQQTAQRQDQITHLDVGCGDGALIKFFRGSSKIKAGLVKFYGCDFDKRSLEWARLFNPEITFFDSHISAIGALKFVDSLSLVEVIEHIPPSELETFIADLASLQKSGGRLYVTVPSQSVPLSRKHYQHFTFDTLSSVFDRFYRIDVLEGFECSNSGISLLRRMTTNKLWRFEARFVNELIINHYTKSTSDWRRCGRIMLQGTKI